MAKRTIEARFWDKVGPIRSDGCRLWTGATYPNGYGQFRPFGNDGEQYAHRFAYFLATGVDPGESQVLHSCDVRNCVEPSHLRLGTHQDNMDDKVHRDRNPKGEGHWKAKLTEEEVREIRALRTDGKTQREIADRYGVNQSTIYKIIHRQRWKYLD